MLSAWVPHARPAGAPRLTFGRSVAKAMDVFDLDSARWPELPADRLAWQTMLRDGAPPPTFRLPSVSHRLPRCRCPFLTSSSGHAAARLRKPTRLSTPRCASWRGVAAWHQEEAQQVETSPSTLYFTLVQRYPPYPDSCLSKVNVWAMSSLLGVW